MERRDRFQNLMQEQGNNKPKRGGNPLHISINRDNANAIVYELKDTIAKQAERPARILIEGLPLYYLSPQNNSVKSWYSEIFKKGWQYVDFISQSLRKPNAILPYKNNLQVTTLLDNTYQTKSVKDAYMLSQMDTRLTKFAKTYIPPRTLRHVIEKRIVKLEKDYNPGNNRSEAVRDAMYQLEKFFDKDGKLRTDQLFIVVHPSTYTDQQKKMIATLFSLIKGD